MKSLRLFSPLIITLVGIYLTFNILSPRSVPFAQSSSANEIPDDGLVTTSSCYVPTWPQTTNITETSATFTWDAVPGALNYSVQIRLVPNGSWTYIAGNPFYSTWASVYNLSPGTTYEWRVRANCHYGDQSGWTYPVSFTTLGVASCDAPAWLNTTNITENTATWSWSSVSNAISYTVQWRYAGGTWYNLGGPWYSTVLQVGGLDPGTDYEWRVRSNCPNGMYSPWSAIEAFTTLGGTTCDVPTWPLTSNITQTSATFSWDAVPGAQDYSVQIRLPNGVWSYVAGSPTSSTWINVYNLMPGTTYEWRVRANCHYGQYSDWTYPIIFTTNGSSSCYAPDWLYTTNITSTSATLDWSPVNGAQSYSLQWRYPGGTWYDVPGGPFTQTWYTLNNLQPGTTYEWRVRSNCSYWMFSPWSWSASFTTLGSSCYHPSWTYTSNITQTSATFHWEEVWGAQSYTVQIKLGNGNWYNVPGCPVYDNWITVYGLNPNTNYCWRVKTNCSAWQYSDWSYPVCFTTYGNSCHAPTWLYTTNITQTSATLDWSPVSGAYGYTVQWRYPGGQWYDVLGIFTETWTTLTGLQPGTSYEWRVRSICSDWMYSAWSHAAYFTTLNFSCYKPSWTYTTDITETSAILHWSAVSGAQSYSVQYRTLNGAWYDVPGSPTTNTSITLSGLNPVTTYEWRVRTNCYNWQYSYWTKPISFTTLGSVCHAPSWLYTLDITETSAKLDWQAVNGAQSYSIQWRNPGGDWVDLPGTFTESWTEITGLTPGTDYEWRVKTNCYNGLMSDWSNPASFSTPGNSCATPTGLFTTNITDTTATFNWSAVPNAEYYVIQIRVPLGTWSYAPGNPFPDTSATVSGFIPGTEYEWRVQTKCMDGHFSDWSDPIGFTTTGVAMTGSEDCDMATTLTVNSDCISSASSNVGATPSSPPPMGWCPTNWYKDVWFKFTMPNDSSPTVTIRTTAGTLTDGVMEVYRGADCTSLTYIYCEDDNYNGNGSTMPVISVTGVANETIWVRVWGYAGTTGTFSICVFDYYSPNFSVPQEVFVPDSGEPLDDAEIAELVVEEMQLLPELRIAPNPVTDYVKVMYGQTDASLVTGIVLFDMSGQIRFSKEYVFDKATIFEDHLDVSRFAPGMYVMKVMTTGGILTERVMVVD